MTPGKPEGGASFIEINVAPGAAAEDGVNLRFKAAGKARRVSELAYESAEGLAGRWRVFAIDEEGGERAAARAVRVEDSSDGTVWLIAGGAQGLELEHAEQGVIAREPYLVLALDTDLRLPARFPKQHSERRPGGDERVEPAGGKEARARQPGVL